MSEPYVSPYDESFIAAFGRGIEQLPADMSNLVTDIVDRINSEVVEKIEYYVRHEMAINAASSLREEAARMASSMLANALAGDDKTIRNLLGFNEWYMKFAYIGTRMPTQWALIDAIVDRRPDIILDERLKQRDEEIALLNRQIKNLSERLAYLANPPEDTP